MILKATVALAAAGAALAYVFCPGDCPLAGALPEDCCASAPAVVAAAPAAPCSAVASVASVSSSSSSCSDAVAAPVRGRYVEARTASVFAGACHYGGERTTAGREAVLAWKIEAGAHEGVSLAGLDVVAVVAAQDNLADAAERESIVYLPEGTDDATRDAALAWLESEHAAAVGTVRDVRLAAIELESANGSFAVRAGDAVRLVGSDVADRACCKMPSNVWYRPFAKVEQPIVGRVDEFACDEQALDRRWSTSGENCAFTGAF